MAEVCDNFSQHAWKKELCSNCLKPRNKHASPIPAKRPLKAAAGSVEPPDSSNGGEEEASGSPAMAKPEARVKPTIAVKPGNSAKPALIGAKPTVAPKAIVRPQQKDNGIVEDGGIYGQGGAQKPPADGAYDDVPHPVPVPPNVTQDHYYTQYDVTFKGLSGKPVPVGAHVRHKSIDRLKNDVEIVLPYNVVDVSTNPPVNDPESPTAKSAARKGRGTSSLAQGDSSGGSPMTRRKDSGSPQFQRSIRILEDAMQQGDLDGRNSPNHKDGQGRTKKSPFQSPILGRKPLVSASDLYEDVEDPQEVSKSEFTRNTPQRSSSGKSTVFEAKLSTIAQNLDLHKKTTGKQPPPPPPEPQIVQSKVGVPHLNDPPVPVPTSKKDKKKAKEEAKPEKQRKGSVGKSFFKKLFSRGGTESDDSDAPPEMTLSMDSDAASSKADDASSTKSSTPGSVEGSPLMSNVRHTVEPEKKETIGKKVTRGESVKEPAPFAAELRQALARGSKIGEKSISGPVGRLKEVKREPVAGAPDTAFAELKGSPLFERRFQQRTYETIDGDNYPEPPPKPNREEVPAKAEVKKVENAPACTGPEEQQRITPPEASLEATDPPSQVTRKVVQEAKDTQDAIQKDIKVPPQVAAKPESKPKPETKAKPKPEQKSKPQEVSAIPEKPEAKPKMVSYPGDTSTCKRRPAPAAPPPPAPMDAPANRRSTSCTSPVSPRPAGPPPPSPKFPPPDDPQDAPPVLPEKSSSRKRDSLKAEEMELYGKRAEPKVSPVPVTATAKGTPPPHPPPVPAIEPEGPAPVLPEKTKKKKDAAAENGMTSSSSGEVYGKRPQISAPTLQRTSAVLDVTVGAGEGASLPDPPPPPVSKTSPQTTSPASTSPQSTLNSDRKQRPRSEISTGKTGTLRRKPDSAPPPPPPEGTRRLSAADVPTSEDTFKRLSRGSSEDVVGKSQSLPRGGIQHSREPTPGGTLGRNQPQRPKVRQTGRAKTLSEGVKCDADDINIAVSKHETLTDLSMEIANKFSQRKLPSPPKEEFGPCLPENYYEMVQDEIDSPAAQRAAKRQKDALERARRERSATPYEDVPGETYDDMDVARHTANVIAGGAARGPSSPVVARSAASSRVNGEAGGPMTAPRRQSLDPTQNQVMTSSAEYLQPVLHDHSPDDECLIPSGLATGGAAMVVQPAGGVPLVMNLSGSGQVDNTSIVLHPRAHSSPGVPSVPASLPANQDISDWRPKPIPRKKGSPTSSGSSYVMLYSDDSSSDSSRSSGFNPAEGWYRLSELQACTLEQIRISLDSMFVGAPASPTSLRWEDFSLESFVPVYCNIGIAFYRATTNRMSIRECLLMLSLHPLPTEVAIQPHLGILHPSALYQDMVSATLFPDVAADPRVYGQCGKVPTTVWVLPFASVCNFEEYCIGLRGLYATKLPIYHRYLCSALQQALSAILYLLNKGCGLNCFQADEILGVTPDGEQEPFVLILPHHCHVIKSSPREPFVLELSQLLMRLLDDRKLASACGMSLNQSRFYRGLYQVAKVLNKNTTPTLFKAQLMCEFMLWGPGEQDLRAVLTSINPQASLDVWLQLERARIIGRYAIEDFVATKEDAHRVHFLVSATDQTLWDTAQLLQQET